MTQLLVRLPMLFLALRRAIPGTAQDSLADEPRPINEPTHHAAWHALHFLSSTLGVPHHEHRRRAAAPGSAAAPSPHAHRNAPAPAPNEAQTSAVYHPCSAAGRGPAPPPFSRANASSLATMELHSRCPGLLSEARRSSPRRTVRSMVYPRHSSVLIERARACREG